MRRATETYVARGVTTAHDGGVTTDMWNNYMTAHRRGLLKNRVQLLPKHGAYDFSLAPTTRCGTPLTPDGMLSMGAVKLFQDGSLQGYTGYLTNPYHAIINEGLPDGKLWRGYAIRSGEELIDLVVKYHRQGWQVAIHGNGDAGIDQILDAFEAAQKAYPRFDARHIVIHCQTVREDQLDRIARLGVVPSTPTTGGTATATSSSGRPAPNASIPCTARSSGTSPSPTTTTPPSLRWTRSSSYGPPSTDSRAAVRRWGRIRPSLCSTP